MSFVSPYRGSLLEYLKSIIINLTLYFHCIWGRTVRAKFYYFLRETIKQWDSQYSNIPILSVSLSSACCWEKLYRDNNSNNYVRIKDLQSILLGTTWVTIRNIKVLLGPLLYSYLHCETRLVVSSPVSQCK